MTTKFNDLAEGYHEIQYNSGFLFKKLPTDIVSEIKITVDEVQKDFSKAIPYQSQLAGQLDHEYGTNLTNKATQYIKDLVSEYAHYNPTYLDNMGGLFNDRKPELHYEGGVWINFQQKYEYNPIHNHSGIFSFVIWHQVPFTLENESKYGAGKDENKMNNGDFMFLTTPQGQIVAHALGIDKSKEGYMAFFPSSLYHVVHPFYTSDDYRITLSGNIHFADYNK